MELSFDEARKKKKKKKRGFGVFEEKKKERRFWDVCIIPALLLELIEEDRVVKR